MRTPQSIDIISPFSNGISFGEIRQTSKNVILVESSTTDTPPSDFFDKKKNKKQLIFLVRKPEEKLYSGLVQSLFLEDTSTQSTQLHKSFSLIKQKPYQYTYDIIKKYNTLTHQCRDTLCEFFQQNANEKILTEIELEYLNDYFEFKFDLTTSLLHYNAHLTPTSANTLKLLSELQSQELVDINKIKIIDISTFESKRDYFKALDLNVTATVKTGQSNKGLYSLVNRFFNKSDANSDLKFFWVQYNYFEQILYNYIISNYTKDNET